MWRSSIVRASIDAQALLRDDRVDPQFYAIDAGGNVFWDMEVVYLDEHITGLPAFGRDVQTIPSRNDRTGVVQYVDKDGERFAICLQHLPVGDNA